MSLLNTLTFGLAGKVLNKVVRDKASEETLITADSQSVSEARDHDIATGQGGGKFVNALRGSVRPIGGHLAQGILFFNILAPRFGAKLIVLSQAEYYLLGVIITFFYGGRYYEKKRKGL
ncbi:hypothetical protein GOV14_03530 [Candidatus Pacearchaeota archaeon]|nr:hypothetical protein [Candidatus Pacearchaeota archaeon]